jgi:mRNA interferase MazF
MIFSKGDIVIIPVPFTDNRGYKLRPAVVISNDTVHQTGDVMIVQITSKRKQDNLSISLTNNDVTENLPVKSYIRAHKIFVIEQKLIKGIVSHLKPSKYTELTAALELGEGQFIEFKELPDKNLPKEMVAFANASGGVIYLGITDNGKIKGIETIKQAEITDTGYCPQLRPASCCAH